MATAVVDLRGQMVHLDFKLFLSCRSIAMLDEEARDAVAEVAGSLAPSDVVPLLGLRGEIVEPVEPEDEILVDEAQHLALLKEDEMAVLHGLIGMGVALVQGEERHRLNHVGRLQVFPDTIGVVVVGGDHLQATAYLDGKPRARVVLMIEAVACLHLAKAELRLLDDGGEVLAAHALEERQSHQLLIEVQSLFHLPILFSSYFPTLSFIDGEYQTRFSPFGPA